MNNRKASLLVVLITLAWGSSYLFMKMGLDSLEEFNLIALRFGIAFLVSGLIFWRRLRTVNKQTIGYGALLGVMLLGVCSFILFGVKTTSTSNAGFLVGLTVIFVPLLSMIFYGKRLGTKQWIGVLLAILGIGFLTLQSELRIYWGDIFCIIGGLLHALYILVSGEAVKKTDPIAVGIWAFGFTAALGWICSLLFETTSWPGTNEGWVAIGTLSIVCTVFCFIAQSVALKYVAPVQLGLMYALEPMFAALFAFLFAGERLTLQAYGGAVLVVAGIVISHWNRHSLSKRSRNDWNRIHREDRSFVEG